jgi:hypothetical protein
MKFSDVALARRVYGHALTHDFSVWYRGGDDTKLRKLSGSRGYDDARGLANSS